MVDTSLDSNSADSDDSVHVRQEGEITIIIITLIEGFRAENIFAVLSHTNSPSKRGGYGKYSIAFLHVWLCTYGYFPSRGNMENYYSYEAF